MKIGSSTSPQTISTQKLEPTKAQKAEKEAQQEAQKPKVKEDK